MIPRDIYAETLAELFAPIRVFLEDTSVSEILINGPNQVYIERRGRLELTSARFASASAVLAALRNVAQYAGTLIDDSQPILEARLPDGSRLEAVLTPIVEGGPAVAIRRCSRATLSLPRLVELGALAGDAADTLRALIVARCNILVAGGCGSGKTSLLNVLASCAPEAERVIVLEDSRELDIARQHVLYMEARKPDEQGQGAIPVRELFRAALRMRPDRLVVGEIRGAEALDLLQAMVSGHAGCLGTVDANHPRDTLTRLETMCMQSEPGMPLTAIRMQLGAGIDVLVQLARTPDGDRQLTHITELVGFDTETGRYEMRDLFVREPPQPDADRPASNLVPTGRLPSFLPRLYTHGTRLPDSVMRAAELHTTSAGG